MRGRRTRARPLLQPTLHWCHMQGGEIVKTSRKMKEERTRNPAADLTDDLILEILSRLPVKSLCQFKCVCKHWRFLISQPEHQRRLPQTLAGFFHQTSDPTRSPQEARHFTSVWEIPLPPPRCPSLNCIILDSCNGLLLCRPCFHNQPAFCYVVCNPTTGRWALLPDSGCGSEHRITRLGFDPTESLDFYVFEFISDVRGFVQGAQIYSSRTGAWSYKDSEWDYDTKLSGGVGTKSVFHDGVLHLVIEFQIVAVDVEGELWWMLTAPDCEVADYTSDDYFPVFIPSNSNQGDEYVWEPGFLGQYQGELCYINACDSQNDLSVWILENYDADQWTLKHQVSIQKLCATVINPPQRGFYNVVAVHPHSNLILYIAGQDNTLMAYNIDRDEARAVKNLGPQSRPPYVPYIPLYSGYLTGGH